MIAGPWVGNAAAQEVMVIEDFERYEVDSLPYFWGMPNTKTKSIRPLPLDHAKPNDFVKVVMDDRGKILRAYTQAESVQIALPLATHTEWDVEAFPRLRWSWRADQLPAKASEKSKMLNDTGAALYIAFECRDWLGRPCTIKYTYSSTLPKETRIRYGKLFAVVVSTALETEGRWIEVERNVIQDYEMLFGKRPRGAPLYIMIWNDSDDTGGIADVYFDDILAISEQ